MKDDGFKHVGIWALLTVVPLILQVNGVIPTSDWLTARSNGLVSIVTGVFLHGNWSHMIGNLVGMLLGISIVIRHYRRAYRTLIVLGIICPSLVMYSMGTRSLGISGLVFTLMWFIIIAGITSKVKERFYTSIALLLIYGASLKTAVPLDPSSRTAWQAHLTGVLVALFLAIIYRLRKIY